ncbi:MAG: hypothetical protein PVJ60_00305 [Phycisphaerales bacterium]|jgi:uncharacterized membrane protein YdbT with pleckstrin-like domain
MDKEKELKEELLKQMDKDFAEAPRIDINSAGKIIKKHQTRLRKLKWIAITGWLVTILSALALHNLMAFVLKNKIENAFTSNEFWFIRFSDTVMIILIIIAVLLTYLFYSTSKTVTMLQISARLANIEEQLKKMSQDK